VSAKQAYYMQNIKEVADKKEWDEFMDEQAALQAQQIAVAKSLGVPWRAVDGALEQAWEEEQ
jgi:hypothetical protein